MTSESTYNATQNGHEFRNMYSLTSSLKKEEDKFKIKCGVISF